MCAKCEKPFLGHRHYERKGLAYCETHYNQVREEEPWKTMALESMTDIMLVKCQKIEIAL